MFFSPYFKIRAYESEWRRKIWKAGCDLGRRRGFKVFLDKMSTCKRSHVNTHTHKMPIMTLMMYR